MPSRNGISVDEKGMKHDKTIAILKRFSHFVIWGLRTDPINTQSHVHRHFYTTLKKLGLGVTWCDDKQENHVLLRPDCLVISYNGASKNLPYRNDVYYALLNNDVPISKGENCKDFICMRVFGTVPIPEGSVYWGGTRAFNKEAHMLWQPWATDLLPAEFPPPVFPATSNTIYWVGSIWNDWNNHGNTNNIDRLKKVLARKGLVFTHCKGVSDEQNVTYVRESRIAPAIGGDIQVLRSMMPCRVWKNISYGQMCVTNLPKAKEVFGDTCICNTDIDELIEAALAVGPAQYEELTRFQQEIVAKRYTYLNVLHAIGRAFAELG
jgi:hypothetical protein